MFIRIAELTKKLNKKSEESAGSKWDGKGSKKAQADDEIRLLYTSIIRILQHVIDWEKDVKNKKIIPLNIQVSNEQYKKADKQLKQKTNKKGEKNYGT